MAKNRKGIQTVLLLFFFSFEAFSQRPAMFSGIIEGLDVNSKLFFIPKSNENKKDSIVVKDDKFSFKLFPKYGDVYFLKGQTQSKDIFFPFFLSPGDKIIINASNGLADIRLFGSQVATEQNDFIKGLYQFSNQELELTKRISVTSDSLTLLGLNAEMLKIAGDRLSYYLNWIKKHKESPYSVVIISLFMQDYDVLFQESLLDYIGPKAKANNIVAVRLKEYIETQKKSLATPGKIPPNFVLTDTAGKKIQLTDVEGKYILIDFWASWCRPCRENNPELKRMHDKYKNSGLNIISVSADTDISKWKIAIIKDNMTWLNASDLLGPDKGVSTTYTISSFPTYILVSNNKIIERSINGLSEIAQKLSEALQSN